ncbi:S24 family peptidase [Mesorhizobium sp. M0715]|uniref:XRE family transcriptional regulator n=1 Tax=Mesorhizobium sp. M0715 TaxID=2956990 RepID=UPI00333C676B
MNTEAPSPLALRILRRLEATGKSMRSASLEVGSDAFIRNIMTGKSKSPRADTLEALAKALGTTSAWLLTEQGPESVADEERTKGFLPQFVPGKELVGDRNFPVYAAARGGNEAHQIVTFEAIEYVKRPALLEHVKDAYGVYVVGESMIPAFEPGDMALVHPHLPPARDKNVVLYHVPPVAEAEAMIKRLLRYDERDWHLRQFNPPEGEEKEFSVARADWTVCHRIVGKYEAR